MAHRPDPPAATPARAHVHAWRTKDWDQARSMPAPDVHLIATTTHPALPQGIKLEML